MITKRKYFSTLLNYFDDGDQVYTVKLRAQSSGFKRCLNPPLTDLSTYFTVITQRAYNWKMMICRRAWSLLPSRHDLSFFDKRADRMTVVLSPVFFVLTPPYLQSSCRDSGCSYTHNRVRQNVFDIPFKADPGKWWERWVVA